MLNVWYIERPLRTANTDFWGAVATHSPMVMPSDYGLISSHLGVGWKAALNGHIAA